MANKNSPERLKVREIHVLSNAPQRARQRRMQRRNRLSARKTFSPPCVCIFDPVKLERMQTQVFDQKICSRVRIKTIKTPKSENKRTKIKPWRDMIWAHRKASLETKLTISVCLSNGIKFVTVSRRRDRTFAQTRSRAVESQKFCVDALRDTDYKENILPIINRCDTAPGRSDLS